jgi:hypothetical protein
MKRVKFNLRKVATAFACLAAVTLFSGCEKDSEEDPIDAGTEQDADIVAFTFEGIDGRSAIDKTAHTVVAKAAETVDLTAIVAEFTLSTGATATVGGTAQTSRQTPNNFTAPVTYKVTSGDDATVNDWTVSITGGKTGGTSGSFKKRTFATVKEVIDFFPEGVYVYEWEDKGWNNDIALYAKASDGSFTFSEINGDPKSSYYEDVSKWEVWKGESYHSVRYDNDPNDPITRYWQVQGDYPGEDLTQSTDTQYGMKAAEASSPWGGTPTATPGETTDGVDLLTQSLVPYLTFIISDDCENAVFEENATIEGIVCKKYSVSNYAGAKTCYYVLDNGFCLKKDGPEGFGSWMDFSLKKGEQTASSCDAVLQKYYHNSLVYSAPTTIASMQKCFYMHYGNQWLGASSPGSSGWVIPWTAGGIEYMSLVTELGKSFAHTYSAKLDLTKFSDDDRQAYFANVKAIPYMKVTEEYTQDIAGISITSFESNNNDDALSAGLTFGDSYYYINYEYYSFSSSSGSNCSLSIIWVKVTIV